MKKNRIIAYMAAALFCLGTVAMPERMSNRELNARPILAETETKQDVVNETPDELKKLYAQSACLLDGESGRVLFEKNGSKQAAMASTTKIMTCIVTLENGNLEDIVTISKKAASQPDVQLNLREGEQIKLKNLLYSLMLESHNDSAVAIAEYIGGSVEGFAKMMNQKAKNIGCMNAHFVTPNGLDKKDDGGDHSITAIDLARVMRYCIKLSPKSKEFLGITRTPEISFSSEDGKRKYSCRNHNAFLSMMEGALSGKTGFTNKAGYCYVGALTRNGKTFIVALLGCGWPNHKTYKWVDTRKLMEYGLKNYNYQDVLDMDKTFDKVLMHHGVPISGNIREKAYSNVYIDYNEDTELNVLLRKGEQVNVIYNIPKELNAPIKKGTKIGSAKYTLGDTLIKEYPIYISDSIEKLDYKWCLDRILERFLVGKTA